VEVDVFPLGEKRGEVAVLRKEAAAGESEVDGRHFGGRRGARGGERYTTQEREECNGEVWKRCR
jgi:hypothetical protein